MLFLTDKFFPLSIFFFLTFFLKVGDGFHVHPVLNNLAFSEAISPWLMFDYAPPKTFKPTTKQLGVGQHPHRGFETITIAFAGEVEHADSTGGRDTIREGDVQWMTAGRGIIHEEFHSREFAKKGGEFSMAQLWLDLPSDKKMMAPGYQPITKAQIPQVSFKGKPTAQCTDSGVDGESDSGYVRIIAGEYGGVKGPAVTHSPVGLYHIVLEKANALLNMPIDEGHNCIVFVKKGSVVVGGDETGKSLSEAAVAVLNTSGTQLHLHSVEAQTQLLVLTGKPLNQPVAARGPFVMNTQEELYQAMMDFQSGNFGR